MVICPFCEEEILDPTEPCPACGRTLPSGNLGETLIVEPPTSPGIRRQHSWQSAEVSDKQVIIAYIDEQPVPIQLSQEHPVSIGRDKADGEPDVDLTPFDARGKGVSHLHAEIAIDGDMVEIRDLDSTNGTYLNGQKLQARQWRILRNLDEVRLGVLEMVISFEDTTGLS